MPIHRQHLLHHRLRDIGALLIIALLSVLFFRPVLFQGAWLPAGGGDNVSFIFPMYRFIADSFQRGDLPLWNPHQYAGTPLIADNQSGMFYPFNLLLFFLNPDFSYRAIEGLVIFHIFLAGAGTYFCARSWRLDRALPRPAALIGAVSYMFSGVFLTHIGNLNLIAVAAWLPLVFLTFFHAAAATGWRKRLRYATVSGCFLGISALAGHAQISFYVALWLVGYALYQTVRKRNFWPPLLLLYVGFLSLGLAAVAVLPALQLQAQSLRGTFTFENAVNYSLPPSGLLGVLAPDFFGRSRSYWGPWPRVEYGYMGVLPWLLAAVALNWQRARDRWYLAGAALFFALLAMGSYTPIFRLFYALLPLPFQVPARFMLLVNFAVALLAAVGATRLIEDGQPARHRFWTALGFLLLLGVLALLIARNQWGQLYPERLGQMGRATIVFAFFASTGWLLLFARTRRRLSAQTLGWAGLLLLSVDLVSLGQYLEVEWNDPLHGYDNPAAVAFLQNNTTFSRIDDASRHWQPSAAQVFGLYSMGGVFNPLQLGRYTIYVGAIGFRGSALHSLLGVEYVVGEKEVPPGDTDFIVPAYTASPDVTIYHNRNVLPRALMLYTSKVVPTPEAAFAAIHDSGFDPTRTVVLESGATLAQTAADYEVQWLAYSNNLARFRVTTSEDGYFLLTDIYYPGWEATVDGRPEPIQVADYAFRAVFVESGTHTIQMRFVPPGWRLGIVISVLTLIGSATLLVINILYRTGSTVTCVSA